MSLQRAKEYLKKYGMDHRIQEFDVSSATVELAAKALSTQEGRIAKTLSFDLKEGPVLIVCAGDSKVDNKKFKKEFLCKAKMIPREEVEDKIGHGVGGVCPFGVKPGVKIYLDESLKRFESVFPACGSSNSAIEMSIEELEQVVLPVGWVCLC